MGVCGNPHYRKIRAITSREETLILLPETYTTVLKIHEKRTHVHGANVNLASLV